MLDQRPYEGHLFTCVIEDDLWIGGIAAQAVGCHNHRQVACIHFGHGRHFRLGKDLQEANQVGENESVKLG